MKVAVWLGVAVLLALGITGWLQWQNIQQGLRFGGPDRWTVVDVHDGDTIRVQRANQVERVRLACIDAPELSQPLGRASRNHLRQLVAASGGQVSLKVSGKDRYDRLVAEVFIKGKFLQAEQVRSGLAYVYPRYLANCPDAAVVQRAEAIAQRRRAGVWQGTSIKPWDYRQAR